MSGSGAFVDSVTPTEPAAFGILSPAAPVVIDDSKYWSDRIDFETTCGVHIRLSAINSAATGVDVINQGNQPNFRTYYPFDIEADFEASAVLANYWDYESIAKNYLELGQQKAVERELWSGALAQQQAAVWVTGDHQGEAFPNKWLASTDATDVTPIPGTPVKTKHALALLEKALGDCGLGVKGVIHATCDVASTLGLNLKVKDDALITTLGNSVVAGVGYTGSSPAGTLPVGTAVWMYATGPVTVRLGPITATPDDRSQSVDTRVNTVHVYSSRPAAVTWDSCCHFAVLVDLALDYA